MLTGKKLLLGVTGGIAAYKSADLVRRFRNNGADVRVVMTAGATAFVTPLTFQALSGHPVHTHLLDASSEAAMDHISLARWPDVVLIAPATADVLAHLAQGQAGDLLMTLCLATTAQLCVAPAMNHRMWAHPATQANCRVLQERGVHFFGPEHGEQACGEVGVGRMREPADVVQDLAALMKGQGSLLGCRVLVTAGPTREPIDPVRVLTNRSSGKMGFAMAAAAAAQGASVTLIAGPVNLPTPPSVVRVDIETAAQMWDAVSACVAQHDIVIAAAAVADYRPEHSAPEKIKKNDERMNLALVRNVDVLGQLSQQSAPPYLVGFALETANLEQHARAKMRSKKLDMVIANLAGDNTAGIESDFNAVTVFTSQHAQALARASKTLLAQQLISIIAKAYHEKSSALRT